MSSLVTSWDTSRHCRVRRESDWYHTSWRSFLIALVFRQKSKQFMRLAEFVFIINWVITLIYVKFFWKRCWFFLVLHLLRWETGRVKLFTQLRYELYVYLHKIFCPFSTTIRFLMIFKEYADSKFFQHCFDVEVLKSSCRLLQQTNRRRKLVALVYNIITIRIIITIVIYI